MYCPTEIKLADFYTKELQGRMFKLFWDVIMGYADISTLKLPINLQFEERVENRGFFQANRRNMIKEK